MKPIFCRALVVCCLISASALLAASPEPTIGEPKPAPDNTGRAAPAIHQDAIPANTPMVLDSDVQASVPEENLGVERADDFGLAGSDKRHGGCGPGVQQCNASQVNQPCDPNNLNLLCSLQRNGSYCCLAYAP